MATSWVLFQEGRQRVRDSGNRGDDRKLVLRLFFFFFVAVLKI